MASGTSTNSAEDDNNLLEQLRDRFAATHKDLFDLFNAALQTRSSSSELTSAKSKIAALEEALNKSKETLLDSEEKFCLMKADLIASQKRENSSQKEIEALKVTARNLRTENEIQKTEIIKLRKVQVEAEVKWNNLKNLFGDCSPSSSSNAISSTGSQIAVHPVFQSEPPASPSVPVTSSRRESSEAEVGSAFSESHLPSTSSRSLRKRDCFFVETPLRRSKRTREQPESEAEFEGSDSTGSVGKTGSKGEQIEKARQEFTSGVSALFSASGSQMDIAIERKILNELAVLVGRALEAEPAMSSSKFKKSVSAEGYSASFLIRLKMLLVKGEDMLAGKVLEVLERVMKTGIEYQDNDAMLLDHIKNAAKMGREVKLDDLIICDHVRFFGCDLGDVEFGDGYRSFQMLISVFLNNPNIAAQLKSAMNMSWIPNISKIQEFVFNAGWKDPPKRSGRPQTASTPSSVPIGILQIVSILSKLFKLNVSYECKEFKRKTGVFEDIVKFVHGCFKMQRSQSPQFITPMIFEYSFGKSKTECCMVVIGVDLGGWNLTDAQCPETTGLIIFNPEETPFSVRAPEVVTKEWYLKKFHSELDFEGVEKVKVLYFEPNVASVKVENMA